MIIEGEPVKNSTQHNVWLEHVRHVPGCNKNY